MEKFLINLLEKNNRVIIPELGAFIIRQNDPKELVFNDLLAIDDGLLAEHVIQSENISKKEAQDRIRQYANQIKKALYATFLTNLYGFRLKKTESTAEKKQLRVDYSDALMSKLQISVEVQGLEKLNPDGQYLLISNHRSIIDPVIVEMALRSTSIYGHWVAKKELFNSFFFGMFTRNAGTILLDRDAKQMSSFFKDTKACVAEGESIFVFPEGTRNKEDTSLSEFKEGSQIIAVKNRLDILPVYIRDNANDALKKALASKPEASSVTIEIGDTISYKDRSVPLEEAYRTMFNIT